MERYHVIFDCVRISIVNNNYFLYKHIIYTKIMSGSNMSLTAQNINFVQIEYLNYMMNNLD